MRIRTLILDDDENSRLAARAALSAHADVELVGSFSRSSQLLEYLAAHPAHLLFLDIELDRESGFAVARRLRQEYPALLIVFLTGHSSYAVDGYDFQPVNFLTKPMNPRKLAETLDAVRSRLRHSREQQPAKLMFRLPQGYRVLDVRDILYIERRNRKNYLFTEAEELPIGTYSMYELEEMLCDHGFYLCHQSFLLSLYRVESLRDAGQQLYEARLRGTAATVPVARGRYKGLLEGLQALEIQVL